MRKPTPTAVLSLMATLLLAAAFTSCVPLKQLEQAQNLADSLQKQVNLAQAQRDSAKLQFLELEDRNDQCEKNLNALIQDTLRLQRAMRHAEQEKLRAQQDLQSLERRQRSLVEGTQSETNRLLAEIERTQAELRKREDVLKELERQGYNRKVALDNLQKRLQTDSITQDSLKRSLQAQSRELEKTNADMAELRRQLQMRDSATKALRERVANALFGFEGQGLTVQLRGGRVYVSLDEKLMFRTGSYDIDPKGAKAIEQLIPVLEEQKETLITVEGHTDDVPMRSSGPISDNWDLSVKRATSIVRILTKDGRIDPARVIASGRAEFLPLVPGSSPKAREQNRRTEIILTPRIDSLVDIIEK